MTAGTIAVLQQWLRQQGLVLCRAEHTIHAMGPPDEALALFELGALKDDAEAVAEWNAEDPQRTTPIPPRLLEALASVVPDSDATRIHPVVNGRPLRAAAGSAPNVIPRS